MRSLFGLTLILFLSFLSRGVYASSAAVINGHNNIVSGMTLVGRGQMTYLLWDVYDAELYAPEGKYSPDHPFALQLKYKCEISGRQIADTSVEEMRHQGITDEYKLAMWHEQMRNIFPNVDENTSLTGLYIPGRETCFYRNNQEIGCINDVSFGPAFFNIWLGPNTRAPELRTALLGHSS